MCFGSLVSFSDGSRPSDKGEPGNPDPEIRGGPVSQKCFGALLASKWSKSKGALGPTTVLGSFVSVQVA